MATCLINFPMSSGSAAGTLAEHLLMFNTVGIYCGAGHVAADHFKRLNLDVSTWEQLIYSKSIALIRWSSAIIPSVKIPGTRSDFFPAVDVNDDIYCYVVAEMDFEQDFVEHTKSFLPRSLAEEILRNSSTIHVDVDALLHVSTQDLALPEVRAAAHSAHIETMNIQGLNRNTIRYSEKSTY